MTSFCTKVLLFLQMLSYTSSFILDNQCLAPSPCMCSSSAIRCDSKQLSTVPAFKKYNYHTSTLYLHLENNRITTIQVNAFLNISTVNATDIFLYLNSNNLSSIASNAFKGIENSTKWLDLKNNNLTSITSGLGQLNFLITLDIRWNPIHTINPSSFANLGHSLLSFGMDLNMFTDWPTELRFLRKIEHLALNKIPFSHINEHSFSGFETVLTELYIGESKLKHIPKAICHLTHLQTLSFNRNTYFIEPIVQPCKMPLVTDLSLHSNHLTEFPNILSQFPSLTTLDISNNQIHLIKAENIPYSSRISVLHMHTNMLSRIPIAINHLKTLLVLNLASNKIESVNDNDLTSFKSLTRLNLYGNPLSNVSPQAFKHNKLLNYLNLDSTELDHVPYAIMSLPKLSIFRLSGKPLQCTCEMSYLKTWNVTSVSYDSKCESSTQTVKDFILHSLTQCPTSFSATKQHPFNLKYYIFAYTSIVFMYLVD